MMLGTFSVAQTTTSITSKTTAQPLILQDGDRVVFLGNSLLENDVLHGYLELALTTRFPDRNVTFRNIGWSGDNVFGDARSYFTNPPTPYELLMKQITEAKPTVVFVAYGGVEAQEGEAGVSRFTDGLNKLLDKIEELSAKAVLLSPIPVLSSIDAAPRNANLQRYATVIASTAAARDARYVDIFNPMQEAKSKGAITDNDIHLNEAGYYHLAMALEKGLGWPARNEVVAIDYAQRSTSSPNAKIRSAKQKTDTLKFTLDEKYLPLPIPKESTVELAQALRIAGLKKGYYTLTAEGTLVAVASASQWAKGVNITQGPSFTQANQLRDLIRKKNEIFFHQYRPHNRTYIVGFRSYEQGRHAEGLKELGLIVTWLEGQISLHRMPTPQTYELTPLK
ncbi:hypothetical protein GCM10007390_20370 [Persicitalea jodogahamensis]|uniref:SGNH hydrolase-type esterase domain-containing protein n=2 Tax=Persicitalea jodogahamensis TaxID=402147 RepID=A0A8J3D6E1_9BACT|nr:hypothetical protein GCM10007390_20370 [Persicitalea jodogahamensis]